jgi:hypothetical protein
MGSEHAQHQKKRREMRDGRTRFFSGVPMLMVYKMKENLRIAATDCARSRGI